MPHGLDELLPSLQALGLWTYWAIAAASLIEAVVLTGVFVPGALIVIAGGMLVGRGVIDFFDLFWFVGIASVIGSDISFRLGRLAARRTGEGLTLGSKRAEKARDLLRRHGGFALVPGRFMGPVAGFVSFLAALSGMDHARFTRWNLFSAALYAAGLPALGYFLGDLLTRIGPAATRGALVVLAVLAALLVLGLLVRRVLRTLPFLLSILRSIGQALAENPDIRDWRARHPRLSGFIEARFDRSRFRGLAATVLGLSFGYFAALWVGSVLGLIQAGPAVQLDYRLANLAFAFRDSRVIWFFGWFTALGDTRTVLVAWLAGVLALLSLRQHGLALGLGIAVIGDAVTVSALKAIFARPRPDLAWFMETTASFPSGHAAISVAFFASVFYALWRMRTIPAGVAVPGAVLVAFLIGLSRIYLIQHYLSDVLNGYLIGTMWLLAGIWVAEMWHDRPLPDPAPPPHRGAALAIALVGILAAAALMATYDKPLNPAGAHPPAASTTIRDPAQLFTDSGLPGRSETITGTPSKPISLILLAPDIDRLRAALARAGWQTADRPGLAALSRAAFAAWTGGAYPNAPVTPAFWNRRPHDLGARKPAAPPDLRQRHHARFWDSGRQLTDGTRIFIATAGFDEGLKWGITPRLASNVDAKRDLRVRDLLVRDLIDRGGARTLSERRNPASISGRNMTGDAYFTDGMVKVVQIDR